MPKSRGGGLHPKPHMLPTPWALPCPVAGGTQTPVSCSCSWYRCGGGRAHRVSLWRCFSCSRGSSLGGLGRGAGCAEMHLAHMLRTPPLPAQQSQRLWNREDEGRWRQRKCHCPRKVPLHSCSPSTALFLSPLNTSIFFSFTPTFFFSL